jgi:HK97 gp10 family phage protein
MSRTIQIQGVEALEKRLGALTPQIAIAVRKQINAGATAIHKTITKSIRRVSNGKTQSRGSKESGNKRKVVASRAGDPPNTDLGNLIKNITISRGKGVVTSGYFAYVRSRAKYSDWLEHGTSKMKKRPYMAPALKANAKKIADRIKAAALGELN